MKSFAKKDLLLKHRENSLKKNLRKRKKLKKNFKKNNDSTLR